MGTLGGKGFNSVLYAILATGSREGRSSEHFRLPVTRVQCLHALAAAK